MSKIDEYKNNFPFGLEEFCKGLSTPERVAIASLLYEKGAFQLNLTKDTKSTKK